MHAIFAHVHMRCHCGRVFLPPRPLGLRRREDNSSAIRKEKLILHAAKRAKKSCNVACIAIRSTSLVPRIVCGWATIHSVMCGPHYCG